MESQGHMEVETKRCRLFLICSHYDVIACVSLGYFAIQNDKRGPPKDAELAGYRETIYTKPSPHKKD